MAPNNSNKRNQRSSRKSVRSQNHNTSRHSNRKPKQSQPKRYFGCGICQADHRLTDCNKFIKMNLAQKYKTAVSLHYCVNCLARNHLIGKCSSKARCHKCGGKHHSTLHGPERILKDLTKERSATPPATSTTPIPAPRRSLTKPITTTIITTSMTKTFVPTVMVEVIMEEGNKQARAILNPTLTKSRISLAFVKDSWLNPFKIDDEVYVKALIASSVALNVRYEICMQVVNDLPKTPYQNAMDESIKNKVSRISLADPEFYSNTPVAMEIGGDLYTSVIQPNVIHIDGRSLIAQDSTLGWLIMGSLTN